MLMRMVVVRMRRAVIVPVLVMFHVVAAGHHEDPAAQAHHVDLGAVQPRQDGPGDHLIDGSERRVAVAEIQHAVERAQQRIQFVGAEQHSDPKLGLERFRQLDDHLR